MGNSAPVACPPRPQVREGITRICLAGWRISHHTNRAGKIIRAIAQKHGDSYESWFYHSGNEYRPDFLNQIKSELTQNQDKFQRHSTSPFVWLETADGAKLPLGGRDGLCEWARERFKEEPDILKLCTEPSMFELFVDKTPGTAPGQQPSAE